MKCLVIVNESPWQTALSLCALRFVQAATETGLYVPAVFFREDGVYNALPGTVADAGTPELTSAWQELASQNGMRLLLCSASVQRRLPADSSSVAFQQTGLAEMLELLQQADRVVSF